MLVIFVYWTIQNVAGVATMAGVDAAAQPFVVGARVFMLASFVALLWLIRLAWRRHSPVGAP
jgi:hypothetical protein